MEKPRSHLLHNLWRSTKIYYRIARLEFLSYLVVASFEVAMLLIQIWFGGRIINDLIRAIAHSNTSLHGFTFDAAVLLTSSVLEQLSWAFLTYFEKRAFNKWSRHIFIDYLKSISMLSISQFEDREFSNKLTMLVQEGVTWRPANFAQQGLYIFHTMLRVLSTLVILAILLPLLIPILVIASLPAFLVERQASKSYWGIWNARGDKSQLFWNLQHHLQDRYSLSEVKPQGSRQLLLDTAEQNINDFLKEQFKTLRKFIARVIGSRFIEGITAAGIILWLLLRVVRTHGKFSVGTYSIYAGYVFQFQSSVGLLYRNLLDLFDHNNFMNTYYEVVDMKPALPAAKHPHTLRPDEPVTIEFKDVSFKYPDSKRPVFQHVNLVIKPKDKIAIVGLNGAGKSTLIKLLLRFYDVDEGSITINGIDLRDLDIESWYYHVGALFQTFNHYPFTLAENVSIGRSSDTPTAGRIQKALALSNIATLVDTLEFKEASILHPTFEKGVDISGGQWQKVALARAFYRNADVLILDEPTSAVDANAEYEIFEEIRKSQANKTTIIVSHRFSTVRQAEHIIVLNKGVIAEEGSHEMLMKHKNGLYYEMFSKQAAGYQ